MQHKYVDGSLGNDLSIMTGFILDGEILSYRDMSLRTRPYLKNDIFTTI